MKRINRFLYKVEYAIKRMNPANRRIYTVLLLVFILASHISWEVWQSQQFREAYEKIEKENQTLKREIKALKE